MSDDRPFFDQLRDVRHAVDEANGNPGPMGGRSIGPGEKPEGRTAYTTCDAGECPRCPANGDALYRVNPKGQPGVFMCLEHKRDVVPEVHDHAPGPPLFERPADEHVEAAYRGGPLVCITCGGGGCRGCDGLD